MSSTSYAYFLIVKIYEMPDGENVSRILCQRPPEISTTPPGYNPFPHARLSAQLLLTCQHSLLESCQTPCPVASAALSIRHEFPRWGIVREHRVGLATFVTNRDSAYFFGREDVGSLEYIEFGLKILLNYECGCFYLAI